MATDYGSVTATCPMYQGEDKRTIACEGLFGDTTVVVKFRSQENKKTHKILNCDSCYENCELYKRIMESKYR